MCGRFTLFSTEKEIQDRFEVQIKDSVARRYNIAPSQSILVIIEDDIGDRKAQWFRWGLIPFWAKDLSIGNRLINARAETLDTKPSFRHLIKRKRCLIISSGFFEWKKTKNNQKQPYFIRFKDQQPFGMAGLWDCWESDEQTIYSCTIITTQSNQMMKSIHHRMPMILEKKTRKYVVR